MKIKDLKKKIDVAEKKLAQMKEKQKNSRTSQFGCRSLQYKIDRKKDEIKELKTLLTKMEHMLPLTTPV